MDSWIVAYYPTDLAMFRNNMNNFSMRENGNIAQWLRAYSLESDSSEFES